jgi:hypothetical protein
VATPEIWSVNVNSISKFTPRRQASAHKRRQRELPPARWQPFNGHILVPPESNVALQQCISEAAKRILANEGLDAFAMPKSAALAHETGHAIVGAHEGLTILKVKVFERGTGIWCGAVDETSSWSINDATPTETALARARYLIGGIAGEAVLDPDNFRKGSSLDEIVLSQVLIAGIWQERHEEFPGVEYPNEIWQQCWRQTCCIVKLNEDVGRDLIRKLERSGRLYGKPLAASLRRVA